jgi:hypothetical protein
MIEHENRAARLRRFRSVLPAAVSLLCLGILLTACSSEKECTYDTDCPGNKICIDGRCVTHYPPDCPDRECAQGFVCVDDKCFELACLEVSCPDGEACAGGHCYPEDCASRTCPGIGEVCIEEKCVPADCLDVECPAGQLCAGGNCYPIDCDTKNCPGYGEVCIDEECVQRTCVGVTCPEGQRCANGYCYPEDCTEVGCFGEGEVCVDGLCQRILCLGVDCPEGYRCANGWCYPADCAGEDCSDFGEVCYEGKCVPTDCVGVVCSPGKRCAHGECFPEECEDMTCESDEVCYDGQCVNWNCVGKTCPSEHNCVDGECVRVNCPEPCTMNNQCATADCGGVEMTCLFDQGLDSPAWGEHGQNCSDGDDCTFDDACEQGVCVGTELVCDEPPADWCDADVAVTYPPVGECQDGECLYSESRDTCPGGCVDGHCEGDPCDGIVCDSNEHCDSGDCVCDDGWADCQGATPGCETELWTTENCTGCGDACEDGNPCTTDVCDPTEGCEYSDNTPAGTYVGLCTECDGAGGVRAMSDDPACGTIDCDGLNSYYVTGTSSPTGTDYCKYDDYNDITSNRCEGMGDCKDANSSDCTSYTTTTEVTCGTCKKVGQCNSSGQDCTFYGTSTSCGTCRVCSGGSCISAPDSGWGSNLHDCVGSNARCDSGICVTCGGYLASDGCSGCAGQGGNACWHEGSPGASCVDACSGNGGCIDANWNDGNACEVCRHFHSGTTCSKPSECYTWMGPSYKAGTFDYCHIRDGCNQSCSSSGSSAISRICACRH